MCVNEKVEGAMDLYKNLRKSVSVIVIIAFILYFYSDIISYAQEGGRSARLFENAKRFYNLGKMEKAKDRLITAIDYIEKEEPDRKDIRGQCHLLLGAIYEKEGNTQKAENNYQAAKKSGVETIEGVVLKGYPLYRKVIKVEGIESPVIEKADINGTIIKEGKKKKKKFPWLIVVGAGVLVVFLISVLKKNKSKSTQTPAIVPSTNNLTVPEGGTASFGVKLSQKPSSSITVTVSRVNGDSDITVQSGESLIFTPSNWNHNQTVSIKTLADIDTENGEATIRLSAVGMVNKDITVIEQDTSVLSFITDIEEVEVPKGGNAFFEVKLSHQPSSDVVVTISRSSGNNDIFVKSGNNLNFTTSDWNSYKMVTLRANQNPISTTEEAIIEIKTNNFSKTITAKISVAPVVSITDPEDQEPVRGDVTINATVTSEKEIKEVNFYIDNIKRKTLNYTPYKPKWIYTWPSRDVNSGEHEIKVEAIDIDNSSSTDTILVDKRNTPSEIEVKIQPEGNQYSGNIEVNIIVTDYEGIQQIDVGLDTYHNWLLTQYPGGHTLSRIEIDLDTKSQENGTHKIIVRVFDIERVEVQYEFEFTIEN